MGEQGVTSVGRIGLAQIRVVGVGGGGVNAVRRMAGVNIPGVELLCVNTDAHSLEMAKSLTGIRIGDKATRGLGAGGDPRVGALAAEEARDELRAHLEGADLVFIAAGMGGGTGTGAVPVVASIAKSLGATTVAVVTTPFSFEGARRSATASHGLEPLRAAIDTLIVVNNDRLMAQTRKGVSVQDAFKMADQVMVQAILAVSSIINLPGDINVDFADVKAILASGGTGIMAIGHGQGDQRTLRAARAALENPLLDVRMDGARGVLFVVNGGTDITIDEVNEAGHFIAGKVDPNAEVFFGLNTDPTRARDEEVELILLATRIPGEEAPVPAVHGIFDHRRVSPTYGEDLDLPPFLRGTAAVR